MSAAAVEETNLPSKKNASHSLLLKTDTENWDDHSGHTATGEVLHVLIILMHSTIIQVNSIMLNKSSQLLPQMDMDPNCTNPAITSTPKKNNRLSKCCNVNTAARNLIARQEKSKSKDCMYSPKSCVCNN